MKLAKVITLNDKVEVIVKKVIDKNMNANSLNFVGIREDGQFLNLTFTMRYQNRKTRDKDFDAMNEDITLRLIKDEENFKPLFNLKTK